MNHTTLARSLIIVLGITLILICFLTIAKADDGSVSIENAKASINQAFENVLAAEKAGGNVTALLKKLNTAGDLLVAAQNAYNIGNLANVTSSAESAVQIANQVNSDALTLCEVSLVESQNNFWLTLIFSVVGSAFFGVVLLFVWRRFKRAYNNKWLSMKPAVVEIRLK